MITKKSSEANEKPNKVLGLASTLVSQITGHNYVGLYFYTNIENDVSRYAIYRSTEKDFVPNKSNRFSELDVNQEIEHVTPHGYAEVPRPLKAYNRQLFVDEDVQPFTTYYYKVAAVDDAGQIGEFSNEASTTTRVANLKIGGVSCFKQNSEVSISNPNSNNWEIRYTVDGTVPTQNSLAYSIPFTLEEDAIITASLFMPGKLNGVGTSQQEFKKIKDIDVVYHNAYDKYWSSTGDVALIDGYRGTTDLSSKWQGFFAGDLDVTLDFKQINEVESVAVGCLQNAGNGWFFPNYIEVYVSNDGKNFELAGRLETIKEWQRLASKTADLTVAFPKTNCRYIKVFAKSICYNPTWHNLPGNKSWLFVDEIVID